MHMYFIQTSESPKFRLCKYKILYTVPPSPQGFIGWHNDPPPCNHFSLTFHKIPYARQALLLLQSISSESPTSTSSIYLRFIFFGESSIIHPSFLCSNHFRILIQIIPYFLHPVPPSPFLQHFIWNIFTIPHVQHPNFSSSGKISTSPDTCLWIQTKHPTIGLRSSSD